jgi:hypothetical protein
VFKHGRSVHFLVLKKVFSSPGPRAQMRFSHHFVSVVCHLLTFCILSAQEPLGQIGPNSDVILLKLQDITDCNLYISNWVHTMNLI